MKRSLALLLIVILSFTLGINLGKGIINYVFAEELMIAETPNNDNSGESVNTKDEAEKNEDTSKENSVVPGNTQTEYIFAKSSSELLNESEISGLSKDEMEKALNEIFARNGHDFSSVQLKEYFNQKSWYQAVNGKKVSVSDLNAIEQQNVLLLNNYIKKYQT